MSHETKIYRTGPLKIEVRVEPKETSPPLSEWKWFPYKVKHNNKTYRLLVLFENDIEEADWIAEENMRFYLGKDIKIERNPIHVFTIKEK
jgi:hypothetical protein